MLLFYGFHNYQRASQQTGLVSLFKTLLNQIPLNLKVKSSLKFHLIINSKVMNRYYSV